MEERQDVPAAVGRVVARSLAKRPEDRFQNVGELAEELSSAAEEEPVSSAAAAGSPDRATNRIMVPTGSNESPRDTLGDDHDEATVVRARAIEPDVAEAEIFHSEIVEPQSSFNPWRIMIPAIAGLLVIFAVVYAITRNSGDPSANSNSTPLSSEPGSLPVQPGQTPTGAGEQGITPNSTSNQPGANTAPSGTNPNANVNPESAGGNRNDNQSTNPGANENQGNEGEAQPSPSEGRNTNQRGELPPPRSTPSPDSGAEEPPPPPTPKKQQTPRPTPPPVNISTPPSGAGSGDELP
jgi:hypothetical protein